MSQLHFESLADVARQIEAKQLSPVEVTQHMLERAASANPNCHAYAVLAEESALAQAQTAEKEIAAGNYKGPLHGVPVAVKDLFEMEGTVTACGSVIRKGSVSDRDATVVAKLKDAGAVILGKLNMTEFALSGYHPDMPVPVNPWAADRWSGVSSSGSGVASALGLAFGTLGTDTGGSIRYPSAVNGVVGIKPTFGRVSKHGGFPLAYTLDHVGPITRRVEDAALMLQEIAGFDENDPFSLLASVPQFIAGLNTGVSGLRIGIDETYCATDAHPEVTAAVLEAGRELEKLGAELVPVDLMAVLGTAPFWGAVVAAEAAVAHEGLYPEQADDYGPVFRGLLDASSEISGAIVTQARLAAAQATATFNTALTNVDALLCPAAPLPAMPLAEFPPTAVLPPEAVAAFVGFTAPMNFSGHPTITVPCGFSSENLPVGMQLVGAHKAEATIIRIAHAYEQATEWHTMHPDG